MAPLIQQFCIRAVALPHNWQCSARNAADVVVFIREEDRQEGIRKLNQVLAKTRWKMLRIESHDRLVEDWVKEIGGEAWEAYIQAVKYGHSLKVFPHDFGAETDAFSAMAPPRLSEDFVDRWIVRAGGTRYSPPGPESNKPLNADYLWEDYIIELKEIRSDALEPPTRQQKLAALFDGYSPEEHSIELNAEVLDAARRREFMRIIAEPIDNQVSKAAKQIRETRKLIGNDALKGAVILINGGTPFYGHDLFCKLALEAAFKPSREIGELFCISTEYFTNGFDHQLIHQFYPPDSENRIRNVLFKHYTAGIDEVMDGWARTGFAPPPDALPPHKAFGFDYGDRTFYWEPPRVPSSLSSDGQ